jgi:hypothetical protein
MIPDNRFQESSGVASPAFPSLTSDDMLSTGIQATTRVPPFFRRNQPDDILVQPLFYDFGLHVSGKTEFIILGSLTHLISDLDLILA